MKRAFCPPARNSGPSAPRILKWRHPQTGEWHGMEVPRPPGARRAPTLKWFHPPAPDDGGLAGVSAEFAAYVATERAERARQRSHDQACLLALA